jgi:hypothetical protein
MFTVKWESNAHHPLPEIEHNCKKATAAGNAFVLPAKNYTVDDTPHDEQNKMHRLFNLTDLRNQKNGKCCDSRNHG